LDQREKIIEGAVNLFASYGVRSVSMDDVSRQLGMSKKTLYQSFAQKDELVTEACKWHIDKEICEFKEIEEGAQNAIDEIQQITNCVRRTMQNLNPSLLYDLQKYHPEGWQLFLDFKHNFIQKTVEKNIKRGIEDGHYRQDINAEIISKMRMEQVQIVFDHQIFPPTRYNLVDVQMAVLDHFIHGLLSDEGRKLFKEYQSKQNSNN